VRIELSSAWVSANDRAGTRWHWLGVAAVIDIIGVAAFAVWWLGVPLVLAAGGALVLLALIWRPAHVWRRARHTYFDRSAVPYRWVVTEDQIQVGGTGFSRAWRWPVVVAVDEDRDGYRLRQDGGSLLDIPRHALTSGQEGELRAFLKGRGLLPPAGRPNRAA
jgi:hypothetical protein